MGAIVSRNRAATEAQNANALDARGPLRGPGASRFDAVFS